jgi:hypothetical protein
MMTMKPAWIQNLDSEALKCKAGDVFDLLVDKITDIVLKWVENGINWLINMLNRVICTLVVESHRTTTPSSHCACGAL